MRLQYICNLPIIIIDIYLPKWFLKYSSIVWFLKALVPNNVNYSETSKIHMDPPEQMELYASITF